MDWVNSAILSSETLSRLVGFRCRWSIRAWMTFSFRFSFEQWQLNVRSSFIWRSPPQDCLCKLLDKRGSNPSRKKINRPGFPGRFPNPSRICGRSCRLFRLGKGSSLPGGQTVTPVSFYPARTSAMTSGFFHLPCPRSPCQQKTPPS